MIIRIPHLLSADDLQAARNLLDKASFRDGRLSAGSLAREVKNNEELDQNDRRADELNRIVMGRLTIHPDYLTAALPKRVAEPFYARYTEGMEYGEHADDAIMGSASRYRADIAVTVFLNAPGEYDGGELLIHTDLPAQTQSIKYAAGDAVLYPASTIHRVAPVAAGVRLVAVTWVQSLVADAKRREILYQLARVRDSLMSQAPNSPEARRVSWVYNDLVRLWSAV